MQDDSQLLTQFIHSRDQRAFALLVERHLSMVYAAARRQVRDDHLAEEVTQKVFLLLAQNAPRIRSGAILPGWLVNAARYYGLAALRSQRRRKHHESQVHLMQPPSASNPDADAIEPLLSDALASLSALDRTAITLRFLEGKTIPDISTAMYISTAAAEKRVSHALDRLRKFFSRRGHSLSSLALHHAPPALAATITAAASSTSTTLTLKGALTLMAISKTKSLVIVAVLLLAASATFITLKLTTSSSAPPPTPLTDTVISSPASSTTSSPSITPPQPASLTFSDGTTVELLALQTEPFADDKWWFPDGTPTSPPSYNPYHNFSMARRPNLQPFHFALMIFGDRVFQKGVTARFLGNSPVAVSLYDSTTARMLEAVTALPTGAATTDFDVGIAAGEWKTTLIYDTASATFTSPPNPDIKLPVITIEDQVQQTVITITPNPRGTPDIQDRWVILAKGKTFTPSRNSASSSERTLTFPCPAADITQLLHQTRPFEFQTFKNVALAPRK